MSNKNNPLVFLDVSIDGDPFERMLFELFSDVVPKTAENFRALCTGEKGVSPKCGKPLHYKGSFFHRIVKGSVAQGGDFLKRDGSYGESIYGGKFPDESPKLKHDGPGLLSMAIADRDSCGSLFTITFTANHHLDRKNIVFGKLVQGHEVLKKIENAGDDEGRPAVTVKIVNSGEFHDTENQSSDKRDASTLKTEKHKKSFKERRIKRRSPTEFFESDSDSDSSDRIDQDSSKRLNSKAQEPTGVNMIPSAPINKQLINQNPPISTPKSNLKCNILASKPFGLHSNNVSRPIASLISPPKGYLHTLEKQNVNINTTYVPSPLSENLKPLNNTLFLEKPGIKRNSEDSGKKERRKASGTNNRSVCCKCSRSQCLKRYCECFAAEMFCANSCTCQGCQNVKENEDMVTEAKEQVESRNPQAFSPKTEGGNRLTASTARNKRVCNCKKSMCLKKYCECYKSGHGCSDGCRCEGCRNINGTKQECLAGKRTVSTKAEGENLEAAAYNEKLEMALTEGDFLQNNLFDSQILTSSTFPCQYSYHGEDASKTQFHFGGFPAQDYTNLVILNQYLLPPSNSNTHTMLLGNCKNIHDTIDFQGEPNYNTTTSDQLNEFSQRDVNNDTGSQLYHQLSSSRFPSSDSLNLINSPILNQTNSFTMTKQIEPVEDEMPEILKEEQKGAKVSSPNKKRISPPLMESGGCSFDDSGSALRSGQKFTLPYAPRGPYSGPTDESTNYPQGYSSN